MPESLKTTSRRSFLKTSLTGVSALTILPSSLIAGLGHRAPSDKLNIAAIGVGGVGFRNITNLENNNIVALCDVDWDYATKAFRRWSNAARYKDFRLMLENEKNIDAVVIATPDHTHSVAAMAAMQEQKHVYVQAPMAHSVFEARRMSETARMFNLVSQVGNQSASGNETRDICEIIWSGAIGEIERVDAWTSQPEWPQGNKYPQRSMRVPRDLDWNLFLGPSPEIPYHSTYTPFGWRAWWKFGNGALGSVAPHLLQPAFAALKLSAPIEIEAATSNVNLESAPVSQRLVFGFARRDNMPRLAMPAMKLYWYDGGLRPEIPAGMPPETSLVNYPEGLVFHGTKGMIICASEGKNYRVIINGELVNVTPEQKIHRINNAYSGGHEADWVRACKENSANRLAPAASFGTQLPLSESILVGSMAVRLQSLRKKLIWNSAQMRFTNINDYEEFEISETGEMYIQNGIPKFDVNISRHNASHFVNQAVRPVYREGWQQI